MEGIEYQVAKLALAPGDALVVKLDMIPTPAQADLVRARLGAVLGEGVPVLVLGRDVDLSVLTRAEIEARAGGGLPVLAGAAPDAEVTAQGASASYVGENANIPKSEQGFRAVNLVAKKLTALVPAEG
jgi:hypothetical protein